MCKKKLFIDDAIITIVLIEDYPCNNKNELKARELHHITNNICINLNKPWVSELTGEEWHKAYGKEYRLTHGEKIKESRKEYQLAHSDKLKEYGKEYRLNNDDKIKEYLLNNTDKIKERRRDYYLNNTDKIKEDSKEYYSNNIEKCKDYRKMNADKVKYNLIQLLKCECGQEVRKGEKTRHSKTNKHLKLLNSLTT